MGKPAGKERGKRTTAIWKNRGVELILVIVGFSIMAYGGLIYRVTDAIPQTVRETLTVNYHSPYTIVTSKLGHKYTILTPLEHYHIAVSECLSDDFIRSDDQQVSSQLHTGQ